MLFLKSKYTGLVVILSLFFTLSSFDLPDEKRYISRKVENAMVRDSKGNQTRLLDLQNGKPLVLSPVYTKCPMACSLISNGLQKAIAEIGGLGQDYTIVSFSFDTTDTNEDLKGFEQRWKMDGKNWKTVTGSASDIKNILNSVDYHYDYDEQSKEYLHPNVVIIVTPSGRISRYIYGIEPKAKDLKLAIMEAQIEKSSVNNFFTSLYVRCFTFNPASKSYHLDWRFIMQTSAGFMFIIIVGYFLIKSLYSKNKEESIDI